MRQQDVAAAIAAAHTALKPAVSAGMFSDDPPKRLSKFLLKFSMTSLKDHQQSSWDETAFQYDDERAQPAIAKATAGDEDADAILREIARTRLQDLPPNLVGYVDKLLAGQSEPDLGGRPRKFFDRDLCIYYAVERIRAVEGGKFNFNPTRNPESKRKRQESASSIVVKALKELGVVMSEKRVERIWQEIHRSTPAGSVLNK